MTGYAPTIIVLENWFQHFESNDFNLKMKNIEYHHKIGSDDHRGSPPEKVHLFKGYNNHIFLS